MTERLPVDPAPGPLGEYLARFDSLLVSRAQRQAIRDHVTALLQPRDRNNARPGGRWSCRWAATGPAGAAGRGSTTGVA